jgi:hypothetical protein
VYTRRKVGEWMQYARNLCVYQVRIVREQCIDRTIISIIRMHEYGCRARLPELLPVSLVGEKTKGLGIGVRQCSHTADFGCRVANKLTAELYRQFSEAGRQSNLP